MSLKRKLARLTDAGPGSAPGPRGMPAEVEADPSAGCDALSGSAEAERRDRIDKLRALVGGVVSRQERRERAQAERASSEAEAALPGALRETPHGPVHVVDRHLEPHHCHGRMPVAEALQVDPAVVAQLALDPGLGAVDPRSMVLVDTETTGLSGGAGTLPFLIGMAWFEDESLRVQQLFLRRPGEEGPMLRVLADRLAQASCLVSYNGKAFDWPLIRNRFVMNRVPMPEPPPHLDLLHCARRVLKRRLGAVRLVHLEAEVLGMYREDDVDGSQIPALYLGWLRGRSPARLLPVIEHNAHDLVALAAILARLCKRYASLHPDDDPRDHLGYAKVAHRARDSERAGRFADAAARGGGERAVTVEALMLSAYLARQRRDRIAEENALLAALAAFDDGAHPEAAEVHLALAKLYEHRLKDAARALAHARHTADAEEEDAHRRRIARLERRLDGGRPRT